MSPLYEYGCADCGKVFTVLKPISEFNTPEKCPKCKGESKKKISLAHSVFKGKGWTPKFGKI